MTERDFFFVESGIFGYGAHGAECARKLGFRPVLLARNPDEYALAVVDSRPLMAEVIAVDTFDLAKLLRLAIERRPAGTVGLDDYRLLPAAVAAVFAGASEAGFVEAMVNARYKDRMREKLAGTEFDLPFSAYDLDRDPPRSSAVGYPCVVKPVDDGGSVGVRICYDEHDFRAAVGLLQETLGTPNMRGYRCLRRILVEAVIPGPEYSAEVAYDPAKAGWTLVGATQKLVTEPPFCVEVGHLFPAPLDEQLRAEVERGLDRLLLHLGLRNTVAHVEFKLDGSRVRVIEVNPRLGGDMIVGLVQAACGVDLLDVIIRLHAGLPVSELLVPTRHQVAGVRFLFPPRAGVVKDVRFPPTALPGEVARWVSFLPRPFANITSSMDRLGFVVAAADDRTVLQQSLERYAAACEIVYEDEPAR